MVRRLLPILILPALALGADLPTVETPVGRLALPVIQESLVISPDSAHVAFAAKAGDPTLEDKGIFLDPSKNANNPKDTVPGQISAQIRLYIDEKTTRAYDAATPVLYSPDSKRFAYAAKLDKKWQILVDNRVVGKDADELPGMPIAFSPDSKRVAYILKKNDLYQVFADDQTWPPIDAAGAGMLVFSPDSQHLALIARVKTSWVLFVDGKALPAPLPGVAVGAGTRSSTAPATMLAATSASRPATTRAAVAPRIPLGALDRFSTFGWAPDSQSIAFYAAFPNTRWQAFRQGIDGTVTFASKPYEAIMAGAPVFSPDSLHMAFATSVRNKWTFVTDTGEYPPPTSAAPATSARTGVTRPAVPAAALPFDQFRPESLRYYVPENGKAPKLLYIAQRGKEWQLYVDHSAVGESFDAVIVDSFLVSPDRRHYVFAATREARTQVIRDGVVLGMFDEAGSNTFSFSPDSQHVAFAARTGNEWHACLDGNAGTMGFSAMAPSPVTFSPDSQHVAFAGHTPGKTWHLFLGLNGEYQSKSYYSFLKNSHLTWRADGTLVTIAIQTKVATRVEAKWPG